MSCSQKWNLKKVCVTSGPRILEVGMVPAFCVWFFFFFFLSGGKTQGDSKAQIRKVPKLLCERKTTDQFSPWSIEKVKNTFNFG